MLQNKQTRIAMALYARLQLPGSERLCDQIGVEVARIVGDFFTGPVGFFKRFIFALELDLGDDQSGVSPSKTSISQT